MALREWPRVGGYGTHGQARFLVRDRLWFAQGEKLEEIYNRLLQKPRETTRRRVPLRRIFFQDPAEFPLLQWPRIQSDEQQTHFTPFLVSGLQVEQDGRGVQDHLRTRLRSRFSAKEPGLHDE